MENFIAILSDLGITGLVVSSTIGLKVISACFPFCKIEELMGKKCTLWRMDGG